MCKCFYSLICCWKLRARQENLISQINFTLICDKLKCFPRLLYQAVAQLEDWPLGPYFFPPSFLFFGIWIVLRTFCVNHLFISTSCFGWFWCSSSLFLLPTFIGFFSHMFCSTFLFVALFLCVAFFCHFKLVSRSRDQIWSAVVQLWVRVLFHSADELRQF